MEFPTESGFSAIAGPFITSVLVSTSSYVGDGSVPNVLLPVGSTDPTGDNTQYEPPSSVGVSTLPREFIQLSGLESIHGSDLPSVLPFSKIILKLDLSHDLSILVPSGSLLVSVSPSSSSVPGSEFVSPFDYPSRVPIRVFLDRDGLCPHVVGSILGSRGSGSSRAGLLTSPYPIG